MTDTQLIDNLKNIAVVLGRKTQGQPNSVALEMFSDGTGIVSHVIFREDHHPQTVVTLFTFESRDDLTKGLRDCISNIETRRTDISA